MEDFHALALTWDTALPVTLKPTSTFVSERQALLTEGDRNLIEQLTSLLCAPASQALAAPIHPIPIAPGSLLGQWSAAFGKSINAKGFRAWADAQGITPKSLRVQNSTLSATVGNQPKTFKMADASGWWAHANPIIFISQLIDPMGLGLPLIDPQPQAITLTWPLNLVLAFHGFPMPANHLQAQTIVEELRTLGRFPGFDDNGRSKSMIYAELTEQSQDSQQLADALALITLDSEAYSPLDIYRTRLQLTSDSRLARTLKQAASLLQAIMDENDLGTNTQATTGVYFNFQLQQLAVPHIDNEQEWSFLDPANHDARWDTLVSLSKQLGLDLYLNHSLSVAAALQAYAIERPWSVSAINALVGRLRQVPKPAVPVVLNARRSFAELYRYQHYVGVLNDRHTLHTALAKAIDDGAMLSPDGLDRLISADPDALEATVKKAYGQLTVLTDDSAFLALRVSERIDPSSHMILSATGSLSACDLDGKWVSLTDAVLEQPRLATLLRQLQDLAAKTGGYLRTDNTVTLAQALKLYHFSLPRTLEEALVTLQRLEVIQPLSVSDRAWWRALKPSTGWQATAWQLSTSERQQVLTISDAFMTDKDGLLFEVLGGVDLAGKSVADVHAEADFLLMRVLASSLAQQLGERLSNALHWHGGHAGESTESGSRNALILAALILSLDPEPHVHPTRINSIDWQDDYHWGESASFTRHQIEASLHGLNAPVAALATHLLLCGKSPHLLVRDIPESTPCQSSQAWVLFRQYVSYMEKVVQGSSRQLSYQQIMSLAYLPPEGTWKNFLESHEAAGPVLDWAEANGVLGTQARTGSLALNTARQALNFQRARLASTLRTFAQPIVTLRQTALQDLRKVYPGNPLLETPLLMWLPENSPFSEEGRFEDVHTGPKYSFVDLHMAGSLDAASNRWHSSNPAIKYREMAKRFHLLGQINSVFSTAFDKKLQQLKAAYGESIRYWLSHLTLPRREAMEYGNVQFFSVSRRGPRDSTEVGRLAVLVYVAYFTERYFYECFPRQMLIRPRRELNYTQVMRAVDTATHQAWMRFDWQAYAHGTPPAKVALTAVDTSLVLNMLDHKLPSADSIPAPDSLGRRVPRTLDSPRSYALTKIIVEQHLLHDSLALSQQAKLPISLQAAANGSDPWADYLRDLALEPQEA
ncbi:MULTISPECIES: hypothetical protein [unclassified Pseudomonas]|uniref:hypothetical protein n=1 Tax=unclassified Pseudomonas TaxID=196821 RepID=UPI00249BEA8D|nr:MULTISPECIES: hypothetical protein [unclassified Pseudomonas]MDI3252718.1 hypothetical protein [Pseudomonas sp. AL10]MDI3268601.1 hypothetical protein [Pseudomonas sp. AL15]